LDVDIVDALLEADPKTRQELFKVMSVHEKQYIEKLLDERLEHPWQYWRNDPVGFVEKGLGETLWSKQKENWAEAFATWR